jgi:hypothetical protein
MLHAFLIFLILSKLHANPVYLAAGLMATGNVGNLEHPYAIELSK